LRHGELNVVLTHADEQSAASMDQVVSNLQLPQSVMSCLNNNNNYNNNNKSMVTWVFVYVQFPDEGVGHALLLMFDRYHRVQVVFDPHWGLDQDATYPSLASALCRRQFHPDYVNTPATVCGWAQQANSIQSSVEVNMDIDEHGVCGIICMLVILCCMRFNYYNPKHIADMIKNPLGGYSLINMLITWYDQLIHAPAAQVLSFILPHNQISDAQGVKCDVYNQKTAKMCSRRPCFRATSDPEGCFCWQHRHIHTNTSSTSRTCASANTGCA
jgi:hypothetical protein